MGLTALHVFTSPVADGTNTQLVRPSNWNSAHLLTLNAVGSEISNAFGNGGGVTFGYDGTNITASAPAAAASPVNFSAGTTSSNLGSVVFSNDNGVTFGLNGATITASVAPGGGGLTNINVSAGTTSNNLSALTFSNLNGITFGLNASTMTASHNGLTTARASNDAIGLNSGLTANGVSMTANSSGLSLNFPAFLTTARGSTDAIGLNTALTAGPLAWTVNSNGLSLNAGSAAGTTSGFAGNSISGSMTHNTAGLNISLSHPNWLTTAMQSNAATISNVVINGSNGGITGSAFTFGNLNGLSFYTSNGSIVGSYTDGGGGGGNFSAGVSNLGNTGGDTGITGSRLVFVGSGEITLSQATDANGATVSIYNNPSFGSFAENITVGNSSNFQRPTGVTFNIAPLVLDRDLSFDWVGNMRSASLGSTTFTGTTNNTTFSFQQQETHKIVIWSKNTGANSLSLGSVMSTSAGLSHSINVGIGAQTTQYTITQGLTYPIAAGTSTYSTTYGVSNASLNISTTHLTNFAGVFMGLSSFGNTLPAGQYWVGFNHSVATTSQHTANLTNAGISMSYGGVALANASVRSQMGIASNAASHGLYLFNGSATLGGGTAVSSVSMGQVTQFASNVMIHARLGRFV